MNLLYWESLFLAKVFILLASDADADEKKWLITCDDVVENLMKECGKLTETEGSFKNKHLTISYWVYEDQKNYDSTLDPLILIHGGPGCPSIYMDTLKMLACKGRKVIRYDQGGVGSAFVSDVKQNAPYLLTMDYYTSELYGLISHLGFRNYHILGHSWGSMVAQEFAITKPENMRSMILVGALSNGRVYIESQQAERHSTLTPYLQKLLKRFDETKDYSSDLYLAVTHYLTGLWTIRTYPLPDCAEKSMSNMNAEIYTAINGVSEFTLSDLLLNWDVTGKVDGEKYPTLVMGGDNDSMTLTCLKHVADGIKNSSLIIIPNAAHMSFIDNPEPFMKAAHEFMIEQDSGVGENSKIEL